MKVEKKTKKSFFCRFPFLNSEIFRKWADFVMSDECCKNDRPKKITKFSSICSQHFVASDFSQSKQRKFLKKTSVPSIFKRKQGSVVIADQVEENVVEDDDEPIEIQVETEDPLNNDRCGLCKSSSCLTAVEDFHLGLVHKCLPFIMINETLLQKLCKNCISILDTFSMFMDKILMLENNACQLSQQDYIPDSNIIQNHRIKVEPVANIEEEIKIPSIQVVDFAQEPRIPYPFTKKCEILEIVDIKPFNFDGSLQQENYEDEDEIQILSPKVKVEIDPDEDGSNELEQIMNYVFISQIFLQDHNYTKTSTLKLTDETVKMEFDDETNPEAQHETARICNTCYKSFKSFKKLLIHKIINHQSSKLKLKHRKQIVGAAKQQQIRKLCSKIIQRRKQKVTKENEKPLHNQRTQKANRKYDCPICGKIFPGAKNVYQHKKSHTASVNYSCGLCEKKFKRAHGLKQHFKSIHENEKNFECAICGHRYLLRADMHKCRHRALKKST